MKLFSSLLSAASKLQTGRKAEIRSLKALADRKFLEIEAAHKLFLALLQKLVRVMAQSMRRIEKSGSTESVLEKLRTQIESIEIQREKHAYKRREQYSEAFVYQNNVIREKGVLQTIPEDVSDRLRIFMRAFCAYFETENLYSHGLRNALEFSLRHVDALIRDPNYVANELARKIHHPDIVDQLAQMAMRAQSWIDVAEAMWPKITEEYHKLNLLFREYGVR